MVPHYHFVLYMYDRGRRIGIQSTLTYNHRMEAQRAAKLKDRQLGNVHKPTTTICRERVCNPPGTPLSPDVSF